MEAFGGLWLLLRSRIDGPRGVRAAQLGAVALAALVLIRGLREFSRCDDERGLEKRLGYALARAPFVALETTGGADGCRMNRLVLEPTPSRLHRVDVRRAGLGRRDRGAGLLRGRAAGR